MAYPSHKMPRCLASRGTKVSAAPKRARNTFAALLDSDSESEPVSVPVAAPAAAAAAPAAAPAPALFLFPEGVLWGDHGVSLRPVSVFRQAFAAPPAALAPAPAEQVPTDEEQMNALWRQPFAADMEEFPTDDLDTRAMSDASWEALMTYLYAHGWDIVFAEREQIEAYPANLPPRIWTRPYEEDDEDRRQRSRRAAQRPVSPAPTAPAAATQKPATKAAPKQVPRFCRGHADASDAATCRYVHGDTIPKVDRPCGFGAACGASDPTGLKRSQCLYIHAECGEVWTPESVIHRPAPATPPASA